MSEKILMGLAVGAIVLSLAAIGMTKPVINELSERVDAAETQVSELSNKLEAGKAEYTALGDKLSAQIDALQLVQTAPSAGGSNATQSTAAANVIEKKNPRIAEHANIKFEMRDCKRQRKATNIKCRVSLTNLTENTLDISVNAGSGPATVLVDDKDDTVYPPKNVEFFARTHTKYVRGKLAPGLSQAAVFNYEDVSTNTTFGSVQITVEDKTNGNEEITRKVGPVAITSD